MYKFYDKSIFKQFFDPNDPAVLTWAMNVLEKISVDGILPKFIDKDTLTFHSEIPTTPIELDAYWAPINPSTPSIEGWTMVYYKGEWIKLCDYSDFLIFWNTISQIFGWIVVYASKFKEVSNIKLLWEYFISEWGLIIPVNSNEGQRREIFKNFQTQFRERGTEFIFYRTGYNSFQGSFDLPPDNPQNFWSYYNLTEEKGYRYLNGTWEEFKLNDGELIRLLQLSYFDEIIHGVFTVASLGWCIGHSSPTWHLFDTIDNFVKTGEQEILPIDGYYPYIANAQGGYPKAIDNSFVWDNDTLNSAIGIVERVVYPDTNLRYLIPIDPKLSYEISFDITFEMVSQFFFGCNFFYGSINNNNITYDPVPEASYNYHSQVYDMFYNGTPTNFSITLNDHTYRIRGIIIGTELQSKWVNCKSPDGNSGFTDCAPCIIDPNKQINAICPYFGNSNTDGTQASFSIANLKMKPFYLPYSQGFLGVSKLLYLQSSNNSNLYKSEIENEIKNKLISINNILNYNLIN